MVVRQAFEELCHRCNGAVVFVSLIGNLGGIGGGDLFNLNERDQSTCKMNNGDEWDTDDDHDNEEGDDICPSMNNLHISKSSNRKRKTLLRNFRKNGAWVDLSSNPFGWDMEDHDTTDIDHSSIINDEKAASCNNSFVHRSTIHTLQLIVRTIREAVSSIEHRRRHNPTNTTNTAMKPPPPIPIVFDTLTPLLQSHGVEKVIVMLKCLRRVVTTTGGTSSNATTTTTTSSSYSSILSPIVAPVLYESLRPSEHRSLEDVADAMIHLQLTDTAASMTTTTSSLTEQCSTSSTSAVIPGMLDLVRRGGSGGGGGKFIRHCVPVRIMRSSSPSSDATNINNPMKDNWHWEILDRDESHVTDVAVKKDTMQKGTKPDQHNNSSTNTTTTITAPPRPRIYLQDDDPDNDIYDEEADYDYG